jgi:hypothetical protein
MYPYFVIVVANRLKLVELVCKYAVFNATVVAGISMKIEIGKVHWRIKSARINWSWN